MNTSPTASSPQSTPSIARMATLLRGLNRIEGFAPSPLPGVRFMRSTQYVPRSPVAYDPGICLMAGGKKIGHLGDQTFYYGACNYLVLAVPLPFECETIGTPEDPVLGLSIGVTPALVAELLLQMSQHPADPAPQAVQAAQLDAGLITAAERLLECLQDPNDTKVLGPHYVREIAYRVLRGPLGGNLRALAAPQSHFGQISRILNRLHTDYARPTDMESLAREAGMSVSTFHERFKAVTASSPLQYLKTIRLHKARMLMVHDGVTAAAAAHQVGYESASQFSREFKRLFGTSPAEEAAKLRTAMIRVA